VKVQEACDDLCRVQEQVQETRRLCDLCDKLVKAQEACDNL
jgi:hypothetical protein